MKELEHKATMGRKKPSHILKRRAEDLGRQMVEGNGSTCIMAATSLHQEEK